METFLQMNGATNEPALPAPQHGGRDKDNKPLSALWAFERGALRGHLTLATSIPRSCPEWSPPAPMNPLVEAWPPSHRSVLVDTWVHIAAVGTDAPVARSGHTGVAHNQERVASRAPAGQRAALLGDPIQSSTVLRR